MTKQARISYGIMAILLVLVGWLHISTLVLTAMFGYFALRKFSIGGNKAVGVIIYIIAVTGIGVGLLSFSKRAYKTLPDIAETTIPAVVGWAEKQNIDLPFSDYASAKQTLIDHVKTQMGNIGHYAGTAVLQLAMLLIGLVIALSLFLNAKWEVDDDPNAVQDNIYATVVRELVIRFERFYQSFSTVIGAQIIISSFNTLFTAVFLVWNGFHYTFVLIGLSFLCGLLPIIGNIISNTLIVGVAFSISPNMALISLIFLMVIHKGEYFLNSKIIGDRIKNPMWLTLIGIVLGEKLMGIPGMILAPVVLHYIKVEASRSKVSDLSSDATRVLTRMAHREKAPN